MIPTEQPTRQQLETAYRALAGRVPAICDMSLGAIADIVRGSPEHDPDRYSDAEIRLASAVIVLAARCVQLERGIGAALEMAGRRWSEWGDRAAAVGEMLDELISAPVDGPPSASPRLDPPPPDPGDGVE